MRYSILFLIAILMFSCDPAEKDESIDRLIIRLAKDPDRVNPLLHPTSHSREVYQYVMLMLGEQNPVTMEFDPLLIREFPEAVKIEEGDDTGKIRYDFELLPDATWSDGSSVTAEDFLFTLKLIFHKGLNLSGYKSVYGKIIDKILMDDSDPRKFTIITEQADKNNLILLCGVEVYPRKFYDPEDVMSKYTLEDLRDESKYESQIKADPKLGEFASQFQEAKYSREVVEGAGPYRLTAWEDNQFIKLERKENYWGNNYSDQIPLQAFPQEIIFQIVEDDVVAINQLSSGEMDAATLQSTTGEKFLELKEDELISSKYNFYTPQLSRFLYIQLNNESPFLSDSRVRKAMAHLIDVDRLIEVIEGGVGSRVSSIFSKSKPYYNSDLSPVNFDIESAKGLLDEAGWKDTNGNGIRDKLIDGELTELKMRLFTSSSALSQRVSLTMKEGASEVGVDIELITQSFRITRPQNLETGDYEMTPMMKTHAPIDNPFQQWHSSQIGGKGQNFARYSNVEVDALTTQISQELDEAKKNEMLKKLQQLIYDDYAIIMLYAPVEKIVVSKKFDPLITSRKPGYLANAFKPVD